MPTTEAAPNYLGACICCGGDAPSRPGLCSDCAAKGEAIGDLNAARLEAVHLRAELERVGRERDALKSALAQSGPITPEAMVCHICGRDPSACSH